MRRERQVERQHNDRWLVPYADLLTLLLAFFVVLYATSQSDRSKVKNLSDSIGKAFEELGFRPVQLSSREKKPEPAVAAPGATQQDLRDAIHSALLDELKREAVAIRTSREGIVVSLREVGFYPSGSATIRPETQNTVAKIASIARSHDCDLRVEGHTDDLPIHTRAFASNWELSTARATEMVRLLSENYGMVPERLSAAGYAEFHPVADNSTEQGRRNNRRVDLVILHCRLIKHIGNSADESPESQVDVNDGFRTGRSSTSGLPNGE